MGILIGRKYSQGELSATRIGEKDSLREVRSTLFGAKYSLREFRRTLIGGKYSLRACKIIFATSGKEATVVLRCSVFVNNR